MNRILIIQLCIIFYSLQGISQQNKEYKDDSDSMLKKQLQLKGITHKPTLQAMSEVPRHLFVPEAYLSKAYDDGPLPIGSGQTISQPFMVAYMTQAIDPKPEDKVLEIGTGSGYQAAVLAELVDSVFTVEIIPELGAEATERLEKMGYKNIFIKIGDGYYGWKEHAPYDAIIVTAAATYIPNTLVDQLKEDGSMVIPIGKPADIQTLVLVKKRNSKVVTRTLCYVRFVPFTRGRE